MLVRAMHAFVTNGFDACLLARSAVSMLVTMVVIVIVCSSHIAYLFLSRETQCLKARDAERNSRRLASYDELAAVRASAGRTSIRYYWEHRGCIALSIGDTSHVRNIIVFYDRPTSSSYDKTLQEYDAKHR
ncbi:MAG: hypothetical protein PVSMB8_13270 [Vulcanimicrobiaceae bacterium]